MKEGWECVEISNWINVVISYVKLGMSVILKRNIRGDLVY